MSNFSRRYKYAPQLQRETLFEEATSFVRKGFWLLLKDYLYVDGDSRYENRENNPLGTKALYLDLVRIAREDVDDQIGDSWYCFDVLERFICNCEWYSFYDSVEVIAKKLISTEKLFLDDQNNYIYEGFLDNAILTEYANDWLIRFKFETYRTNVNNLFFEENIGWRLNSQGSLERNQPEFMKKRLDSTIDSLDDKFAPARKQFLKAINFLEQRPQDSENAIKEAISALESVAKILSNSQVATLGEAIKQWRKTKEVPTLLLTVIEKFYAFTNDSPLVRHGSERDTEVSVTEAEFCLHVSSAAIRYLMVKFKK